MKVKLFFILIFFYSITFSQIGINTPTPSNTLDINGTLRIRSVEEVSNSTSSGILLTNSVGVVSKINQQNFITALKIPTNIFNAEQTTNIATELSGNNVINRAIFGTVNINVAEAGTWNASTNTYTVAKRGIYQIVSGVFLTNTTNNTSYVESIATSGGNQTVGGIFLSGNLYSINASYVKLLNAGDIIFCNTNTGSTNNYRQGTGFLHIIYTAL